jgi:hypothetical protein
MMKINLGVQGGRARDTSDRRKPRAMQIFSAARLACPWSYPRRFLIDFKSYFHYFKAFFISAALKLYPQQKAGPFGKPLNLANQSGEEMSSRMDSRKFGQAGRPKKLSRAHHLPQ